MSKYLLVLYLYLILISCYPADASGGDRKVIKPRPQRNFPGPTADSSHLPMPNSQKTKYSSYPLVGLPKSKLQQDELEVIDVESVDGEVFHSPAPIRKYSSLTLQSRKSPTPTPAVPQKLKLYLRDCNFELSDSAQAVALKWDDERECVNVMHPAYELCRKVLRVGIFMDHFGVSLFTTLFHDMKLEEIHKRLSNWPADEEGHRLFVRLAKFKLLSAYQRALSSAKSQIRRDYPRCQY